MKSQNLDRLTSDQRNLLAYLMTLPLYFWPCTYMIEVRLDDPTKNLLEGEDGLHRHAGNGSRDYARHYGDPDWAIVHIHDEDVRDWDWKAMSEAAQLMVADYQAAGIPR